MSEEIFPSIAKAQKIFLQTTEPTTAFSTTPVKDNDKSDDDEVMSVIFSVPEDDEDVDNLNIKKKLNFDDDDISRDNISRDDVSSENSKDEKSSKEEKKEHKHKPHHKKERKDDNNKKEGLGGNEKETESFWWRKAKLGNKQGDSDNKWETNETEDIPSWKDKETGKSRFHHKHRKGKDFGDSFFSGDDVSGETIIYKHRSTSRRQKKEGKKAEEECSSNPDDKKTSGIMTNKKKQETELIKNNGMPEDFNNRISNSKQEFIYNICPQIGLKHYRNHPVQYVTMIASLTVTVMLYCVYAVYKAFRYRKYYRILKQLIMDYVEKIKKICYNIRRIVYVVRDKKRKDKNDI